MKGLGSRIRARRQELGLRQRELALSLGTTPQTISKWEVGESDPGIQHLPVLARLLRVSVDWLLAFDDQSRLVSGSVVYIGIASARARGGSLDPRAFAAWCQSVLALSVAAVEAAGGTAVTAHGPGLLAVFTGPDHAERSWQAACACAGVHADPLKIGIAQGRFHLGEIHIGAQRRTPDVYGQPVGVALALADWIVGRRGPSRADEHGIAMQGVPSRQGSVPAPTEVLPTVALGPLRIERVSCWFLPDRG